MIKKILIAIVAIVVLLTLAIVVATFTTPTDFKVEREVTINKPAGDVYSYAKFLKNQNDWGPWFKREPTMKQEFRGTDGTVGFVSYWNGTSDETGEGEQEIKKLVENQQIETELRFKRPFESKASANLMFEPAGPDQTRVKWILSGSMPRPLNIFLLVMDMDKAMGSDLTEGLQGLKSITESR